MAGTSLEREARVASDVTAVEMGKRQRKALWVTLREQTEGV